MSEPLVSIVIPNFNHGVFLSAAVRSALEQEGGFAREVIVVDDGSTDPSTPGHLEAARNLGARVLTGPNAGPAAARNRGIREARGRYILPLDADDRLEPHFLRVTVPILEAEPGVGIVYGKARYFGAREGVDSRPGYRFPAVLLDPSIYCTALFRRADWEAVGGFRESMASGWEDFDFWLSLIERGVGVRYLPEVLFHYRQHPEQKSRDGDFIASRERILDTFETLYRNHQALYDANIRELFAAHLDRRDWWNELQHEALPFIRPVADTGILGSTVTGNTPIRAGEGPSTVRFTPFPTAASRIRLHPYTGPCEVWLDQLRVIDPAGHLIHIGPFHELEFCVARSLAGGSPSSGFLFLDRVPRLEFEIPEIVPPGSMIEIRFRVEPLHRRLREVFSELTEAGNRAEDAQKHRESLLMRWEILAGDVEQRENEIGRLQSDASIERWKRRNLQAGWIGALNTWLCKRPFAPRGGRRYPVEAIRIVNASPGWSGEPMPSGEGLCITLVPPPGSPQVAWRELRIRSGREIFPMMLSSRYRWIFTGLEIPLPARVECLCPGCRWKSVAHLEPGSVA